MARLEATRDDLFERVVAAQFEQSRELGRPDVGLQGAGRAEASPGFEDAAGGPGIVAVAAQIPGVAQRRRVLRAPALPREDGRVGERQALTPEAAERVFGAGDRIERGERRAGEKSGLASLGHSIKLRSTEPSASLPSELWLAKLLARPFLQRAANAPLGSTTRVDPPLGVLARKTPPLARPFRRTTFDGTFGLSPDRDCSSSPSWGKGGRPAGRRA